MKQRIYYRIMKVTQTFPVILWLFFSSFLFATYTHAQTIKGEQSTEGITIFKLPTDPDQMWELTKEGTDSGIRSNGNYPPIWEHPVNTGTIHNYIVNLAANPRVNNIPLQPGDWMGGFYLDDNNVLRCGGSRMWTGTENVMITLFGDDNMTPEKDGFDFGELIEFRFFLQQTQKEYVVSIASYHVQLGYVTNGRWYPLSLSMFMDMKAVCAFDFYIQASENPTCIGNQVTLSAEEFVGTGGPYTYSWSSIPEGFNYNIKNPPPITLNVTTDFFLTVTAPNNISNHQITLLVHDFPTANAGSDGTICENEIFNVSGTSTNAFSVLWETNGDGSFTNPTKASTNYTPGPIDKVNGTVELTFNAEPFSPCQTGASDNLTLTIQSLPTVDAGPDMNGCETLPLTIEATSTNYSSVQWTTSGTGTFSDPNSLITQYTPSSNDITNDVTLTVSVQSISPCQTTTSDNMKITFIPPPTCSAPTTIRRCEGTAFNLNGSVTNSSGILWTTQGDGTFANPEQLQTIYYPGPQDIENSGTQVTLTAYALPPCTMPATKAVSIIIQQLPRILTFGENTDFACNEIPLQLNAEVTQYNTISWSRTGDGTFNKTNILNPIYTPGPNDKTNGFFTLTLSATSKVPCLTGTTLSKTIYIVNNPTVEINTPSNQLFCAELQLQATANSYDSLLWITNGDGNFSNSTVLNPTYYAGENDMDTGANIKLTLVAAPIAPCLVAAESYIYASFKRPPSANAGNNATICENQTHTLNGIAQSYSTVQWETNGSGTFNNPLILNPVYTPSDADKTAGSVALTLTAQPISPCADSASDQMILTIKRLAVANAGSDATICEDATYTLNGTAQRYSSVSWSSSGTGTFNNPSILKPVYTPSEQDKNTGLVIITLTVQPISPCAVAATDYVIINIYRMPVVSAGNDAAICEDEAITLNGTAQRYSSLSWSTSGTGTFNNPSILKPVYTPSAADKTNGSVALTLTVQPISPCSITVSDQMTLFIENLNIIHNLEPTQTVNMGSTLNLVFEVEAHNDGIYTWFFNDEAIENSNNSIFTIPSISATDAGYYLCLFVHNCGEVSSNESFVQVIQLSAHEINLPQLWSGISSYVVPDNPAMNAIFAQIINNIEIVQNYDGIYWPSQNINTLGNWSTTKGYRIKMLNTDQLMISGTVQYPVDELTLPPNWSIIPVNVPCIINTSEFFSDYPSILMIKEIAGSQIYWPEYNINSLVELLPGKAYEIYNSSSQPINITFPLCDGPLMNFEFKSVEPDIIHPWNPIYKTPISHIFGFLPEATGQFEQGDLIGIFTQSDLCAGIAKVEVIDKAFSLTAFGTDIFASDKTGFEYAEPVKFKIFKPTTGQEYPLNIQYSDGADESLFTANGITLIKKAECLMTNVESQSGLVKDFHVYVFPNPTTGNINITLTSNATFDGKFEIINTSGQLIQKVNFKHTNNNTTQSVDLSNNPAGIYYLRIIGENILKTRKILLR